MAFSVNLLSDLQEMWSYQFMQHAFEAGTLIAVIAGVMGSFDVLRRSALTAHAFSEIASARASGALLNGINPDVSALLGSYLGGPPPAQLGRRPAKPGTQ